MSRPQSAWRQRAWMLMLPLLFVLYTSSFSSYPPIEKDDSVLADADSSNYILLLRDFGLTKQYGDPYTHTDEGRSIGDTAQKHKIHHPLYFIVAGTTYEILAVFYKLFGLAPTQAVYAINALITCVSLVLLWMLLGEFNPSRNPRLPFLIFYAAALSTWIYAGIPESWPLSGMLILTFLLVYYKRDPHYMLLALLIGGIMLNNMILAFLLCFVLIKLLREGHGILGSLARCTVAGLTSIGVWLSLLTVLSVFDSGYRPDQYVKYTFWFRDFTKPDLNMLDPFVWKSVLSNLYITSVVSNQPDPFVPQEALLYTLQTSKLGLVATLAYLVVFGAAFWSMFRETRTRYESNDPIRSVLENRAVHLVCFFASIVAMNLLLYYPSGFLYSTTIVALLAVFLCRCLDMRRTAHAALLYVLLALMLVNNTMQVLAFREALAALG